jgi:type I restriction enzyme, R subunit
MVYELDPEGRQLRVVRFTDYTGEKVRDMYSSAAELRSKWGDAAERTAIIAGLDERGITFEEMAEAANQPDADPFDLLCHIAYNAPLRTRRERAQALRRDKKDFFEEYGSDARAVLDDILEKYVEYGTAQFQMPEILKVPPISQRGTVTDIIRLFGGAEHLRQALQKMQQYLYAA